MSCLLYAKDNETKQKINLEDLYEKEQKRNQKMLSTFVKILNRIHKRIQVTAKSKFSDKHIFFNVPEFILGEPNYDKNHCIAYLFSELEENEFFVKYIHPNTLYVSWDKYVPFFVREQIKKKTGIEVDTKGVVIGEEKDKLLLQNGPSGGGSSENGAESAKGNGRNSRNRYKSTDLYKPTGDFVYGSDLFDKIEKRFKN